MARLCDALDCQPGDLLSYEPRGKGADRARGAEFVHP
jgi:DNA-binding Xre family transcriptional regulator